MARRRKKTTAKGKRCRMWTDAVVPQGRKSGLWKDYFAVCMRSKKPSGLGYVPKAAGSPQYKWKVKRRGR